MEPLLHKIQKQLESLYGIHLSEKVEDYLIDRKETLRYLSAKRTDKIPKELFLVRRNNGSLVEIALFLDTKLLSNLEKNNPYQSLNEKNLSDFCILVEGISHFVYYLWKTYHHQTITRLEMELQAEIDKFLMLYFYLRSEEENTFQPAMFDILFEEYSLHQNLSDEAQERYLTASSLASRYCYFLKSRFSHPERIKNLVEEVREFYNLSQEQKIQHIIH